MGKSPTPPVPQLLLLVFFGFVGVTGGIGLALASGSLEGDASVNTALAAWSNILLTVGITSAVGALVLSGIRAFLFPSTQPEKDGERVIQQPTRRRIR